VSSFALCIYRSLTLMLVDDSKAGGGFSLD
jgi:hypothetical protein